MLRIQQRSFLKLISSRSLSSSLNPDFSSNTTQESRAQQIVNAEIKSGINPVPVFKRAVLNNSKIAIKDALNGEKTYTELLTGSYKLSTQISDICEKESLSRVAFLCNNDISYIISQWATWISGQIAVPLCKSHPAELLEFYINDSQSNLIVTTPEYEERLKPIAEKLKKPLKVIEQSSLLDQEAVSIDEDTIIDNIPKGSFYKKSPAMIVYTSGTTSKPKGVMISYSSLEAQIASLKHAWNIQPNDTILHSLPLHHVHGVINALLVPLSAGSRVTMLPKFDPDNVWTNLLNINMPQKDRVTVYMGVPTSYSYLIQEYDKLFSKSTQMKEYIRTHCQNKIRLMVSGSAPLPQTIFQRWKDITGHKLLERYGMTEIGMCLSNTLKENKERSRLPGFVGQPLPGVNVRIVNPDNESDVLLEAKGDFNKGVWSQTDEEEKAVLKIKPGLSSDAEIIGSLEVKGPNVFEEYWDRPKETQSAFRDDGWFITGDAVCYDPTVNSFKIMGRNSVDIIKSRGYKISALEIETKLLENPLVEDCAVIGVADEVLGQKVVALVVYREIKPDAKNGNGTQQPQTDKSLALKKWCESKFASYCMPSITVVSKIPRNQMGKVNKADLLKDIVKATSTPVK
jgi:malonyl-CoA/methylmalonyl-CoA synthetase